MLLIDHDNPDPDGMPTFQMNPKHGTLEPGKTMHIDVVARKSGQTKVIGGAQIGPAYR